MGQYPQWAYWSTWSHLMRKQWKCLESLLCFRSLSPSTGMSTFNEAVFLRIKCSLLLRSTGDLTIHQKLLVSSSRCVGLVMLWHPYMDPMLNILWESVCVCVNVSRSVHDRFYIHEVIIIKYLRFIHLLY